MSTDHSSDDEDFNVLNAARNAPTSKPKSGAPTASGAASDPSNKDSASTGSKASVTIQFSRRIISDSSYSLFGPVEAPEIEGMTATAVWYCSSSATHQWTLLSAETSREIEAGYQKGVVRQQYKIAPWGKVYCNPAIGMLEDATSTPVARIQRVWIYSPVMATSETVKKHFGISEASFRRAVAFENPRHDSSSSDSDSEASAAEDPTAISRFSRHVQPTASLTSDSFWIPLPEGHFSPASSSSAAAAATSRMAFSLQTQRALDEAWSVVVLHLQEEMLLAQEWRGPIAGLFPYPVATVECSAPIEIFTVQTSPDGEATVTPTATATAVSITVDRYTGHIDLMLYAPGESEPRELAVRRVVGLRPAWEDSEIDDPGFATLRQLLEGYAP